MTGTSSPPRTRPPDPRGAWQRTPLPPTDPPRGQWLEARTAWQWASFRATGLLVVVLGLVLAPAVAAAAYLRALGPAPEALTAMAVSVVLGVLGLAIVVRTLRGVRL